MANVDWNYYNKFRLVNDRYLPMMGEGETKATQIVTAVNKLIYKWYNDGDVYDNTGCLNGWSNDLSSYANWLRKYTVSSDILDAIYGCRTEGDYEALLQRLADRLLDEELLEKDAGNPAIDSIYTADGPFRYIEPEEDEDAEWEEEWEEEA